MAKPSNQQPTRSGNKSRSFRPSATAVTPISCSSLPDAPTHAPALAHASVAPAQTLLKMAAASPSASRSASLSESFDHLLSYHPNLLSFLIFMAVFHVLSFLFFLLDTHFPDLRVKRFRGGLSAPTYVTMLPRVLFNQLFILLPFMLLSTHFGLTYPSPPRPEPAPLASLLSLVALGPILHEAAFYVFHRFVLHSSWGFRLLDHRLHHTSLAHSAISAMYMSTPDFVLEIVVPYLLPLAVLSSSGSCSHACCVAMLPLGALGGLYEHSGYNFFEGIAALDTSVHALHHRFYNCSFADGVGAPSVFDAGFGTACTAGPSAKVMRKWLGFKDAKHAKEMATGATVLSSSDSGSCGKGDDLRCD